MKKRTFVIVVVIALILLAAFFYLRVPGSAPPNQEPLVTLTPANITQFAASFDAHMDMPRVILLLSPT